MGVAHAYHLTLAKVPFGGTHGSCKASGSFFKTICLLAITTTTPTAQDQATGRKEIFSGCIGFLDGSGIPLQSKPKCNNETYFSSKKIYGFDLQNISNWNGWFIYAATGYTTSAHDSTAFKSCILYRGRSTYMSNTRIFLQTKHINLIAVITPYREAES